jgi:hypothetical protein
MFYFKNAPIESNRIDPEQLSRVAAFKRDLQTKVGLTFDFLTGDDLQKFVRLHLTSFLADMAAVEARYNIDDIKLPKSASDNNAAVVDDELGYLDHLEIFENSMLAVRQIVSEMTDLTTFFTIQLQNRTKEIGELTEHHRRTESFA